MYQARITRHTPTAIVVLVDQSGSMSESVNLYGATVIKAQAVATVVDMMLGELLLRCKCEGYYRDYFDVSVLSYSGGGVRNLLTEDAKKPFVSISSLAHSYFDVGQLSRERVLPSGQTTITTLEYKKWIEPSAVGGTPMLAAFERAFDMLEKWVSQHRSQPHFPPMVFNITDGEASDASDSELVEVVEKMKSLSTADGGVLLFNIHLASGEHAQTVLFAQSESELAEHKYAKLLYDMSSLLPAVFNDYIEAVSGKKVEGGFRGVSFNTDMNKLLGILNIGSASINIL